MMWYSFSEVVTDVTSKFTKIKASDYHIQGRYKIIDQGKDPIAGYTDDANLVNGELLPILIFGDHTRVLKYEKDPIALGADGAKALWVNPELANARYVYYYLRSIQIKEAGYSRHFKFLKEIEIPIPSKDGVPDFDNQIRIAHLLSTVDGLIAQRNQHLQQLDDLLKSVFLEMFGDPVRNEKGWNVDHIGRSIKVQGGFAFKSKDIASSGTIKLVKIANVHFEDLTWEEISYVPDSFSEGYKKFALQEGDLLIALTRPVIKSLNVVKTATVRKKDLPCMLNQRVARFLIDQNQVNKRFFLQYCYTEFFRDTVEGLCPPGLQPNVSTNQIEDIPFFYPPIELQDEFAAIAEKVEGIKSRYQQSLTDLEFLYGALSQEAFKGELDLSRASKINPLPHAETSISFNVQAVAPSVFPMPNSELLHAALLDRTQLPQLLHEWLESYRHRSDNESFSPEHFLSVAKTRLVELHPENDYPIGQDAYEVVKKWVFDALEKGLLQQSLNVTGKDDEGAPILDNKLILKTKAQP